MKSSRLVEVALPYGLGDLGSNPPAPISFICCGFLSKEASLTWQAMSALTQPLYVFEALSHKNPTLRIINHFM